MVLAAYVAGLLSTPAAVLGVVGGMRWWATYRRAQSVSEPMLLTPEPPLPPSPQGDPVQNRISMRSVPGSHRKLRGRRTR